MTGDCKSLQPSRSRPAPTSAQSTTVDFATVAAVSNRQVRSCRATKVAATIAKSACAD